MKEQTKPLFRKAGKGYNKEDVNAYITSLSHAFNELSLRQKALVDECNARGRKDFDTIAELREKLKEADALKAENEKLAGQLTTANAEIKKLSSELESRKEQPADNEALKKAEAYDKLCSHTGEVLLLARNTADTILSRANDEAERIVSDANAKKDNMFRNISDTADSATTDLSEYIKNAVNECIEKINNSISNAENIASEHAEIQKKTK